MSQETLERLETVYEAVSRGDWDTALRDVRSDFELIPAEDNPITGTVRGPEEVRRFFEEFWAAFDEVRVEPERVVDLDDRILVFLQMHLWPADSAAKFDMKIAHIWTVRDGDLIRCEVFREPEDALAAVGMSERDVSPPR
jgi:ketosteroid isomerase-like protein